MSFLSKVKAGRSSRPQKVVIYSVEGLGKSTLASQFPDPLFLDIEGSTAQLPVSRIERADLPSLKAVESALMEIAKERPCKTVVIDTLDWLEQMAVDDILAAAKPKKDGSKVANIEDFGYGAGFAILSARMEVFIARLDDVIRAGMHVVCLAHMKVVKFDAPDQASAYDRYELKLTKLVAPLFRQWADVLLFGNYKTNIRETDSGKDKGLGGKERLMHTVHTAAWDAKNRHQMPETCPWGINPIREAFLRVGAPWDDATGTAAPVVTAPAPKTPPVAKTAPVEKPAQPAKTLAQIVNQPDAALPAHYFSGNENPFPAPEAVAPTPENAAPAVDYQEKVLDSIKAAQAAEDAQDDQIPGLPLPLERVDVELQRICAPHSDAITCHLRNIGKITALQTWRDMPEDWKTRAKSKPAEFLKFCKVGKAVAA